MAALNQAKIIKGLREITSGEPDRTFFFKFLKLYGPLSKSSNITIQTGILLFAKATMA